MQANTHPEDICIWSDGTWCFREEVEQYHWMSDDYHILYVDTAAWKAFDPDAPTASLETRA